MIPVDRPWARLAEAFGGCHRADSLLLGWVNEAGKAPVLPVKVATVRQIGCAARFTKCTNSAYTPLNDRCSLWVFSDLLKMIFVRTFRRRFN